MLKAYAQSKSGRQTVGQNPRARRRANETEGDVIRRAGTTPWGRVTAVNGRRVNNVRPVGR